MMNYISITLILFFLLACGPPEEPTLNPDGTLSGLTEEKWDELASLRTTTCPGPGASRDVATQANVQTCNSQLLYFDRASSCTTQKLAPIPCDISRFNEFLPESLVSDLNALILNVNEDVYQGQLDQCVLVTDVNDPRIQGGQFTLDVTKNALFVCYFATPSKVNVGQYDFNNFLILPVSSPVPPKFY